MQLTHANTNAILAREKNTGGKRAKALLKKITPAQERNIPAKVQKIAKRAFQPQLHTL